MFCKGKCFINCTSPPICHLSIYHLSFIYVYLCIIYVYLCIIYVYLCINYSVGFEWQVWPFPNILGRKSVGKRQRRLGHVHKTSF